MVARIEDERRERETLEQQRQELLKRKQKLIAENKKRREDLANLDNDLEKFIDVRLPLPAYNKCTVQVDRLGRDADHSIFQAAKPIQKMFEKDV